MRALDAQYCTKAASARRSFNDLMYLKEATYVLRKLSRYDHSSGSHQERQCHLAAGNDGFHSRRHAHVGVAFRPGHCAREQAKEHQHCVSETGVVIGVCGRSSSEH
jgi:hypothetical protein